MPQKMTPPTFRSPLQRGISLIESLVAIVVMALGILGVLGVQMRTLTDTQTTVYRAQAIRLIEDLSERMKTNPNALANINNYVSDFSDEPTPGDCSDGCSHSDQAAYDLALWKQAIKTQLPLGKASVFLAAGETDDANRRQLGVMVAWRENERDMEDLSDAEKAAYKNSIDATKVMGDDGELKDGAGDIACPDNHTCHLQYLSVAARCAPYRVNTAVNGEVKYFCPGS